MTTATPVRASAGRTAWDAVRFIVLLFVATDTLLNFWQWPAPSDLVLAALSAAAVVTTLFRTLPGAILAVVPLLSDIVLARDYGLTPLLVVTVMVAAVARPRTALVILTAIAGLRVGHVWWSDGSYKSFWLAGAFAVYLVVGLVLRWLIRRAARSSAQLSELERQVHEVREDERAVLADELSRILTHDLQATTALLETRASDDSAMSLVEADARTRESLARLRQLISALRGVPDGESVPRDLLGVLEEAEDLLVGQGFVVELDGPDPSVAFPRIDVDAMAGALREGADQLRQHQVGGLVRIGLVSDGDEAELTISHRDIEAESPGWTRSVTVPGRPFTPVEQPIPPPRPFLSRFSLNTVRLALAMPSAAAAGMWLMGMAADGGAGSAVATADLIGVAAFGSLALAAWAPRLAALVLAVAWGSAVLALPAVDWASPFGLLSMVFAAVVAVNGPRLLSVVGVGAVLASSWWYHATGDLALSASITVFLALGAAIGFGVRYFLNLRDEHLVEHRRLSQEFNDARTSERLRLAGELHDIVAHQLTLMTMVVMAHGSATDPDELRAARERLAGLNAAAEADLATLVNLIRQDSSPTSEPGIAPSQVLAATATTVKNAGYPVDLTSSGPVDVCDQTAQRTMSRVLREATTNVLRYAPPGTPVDMVLTATDETVGATVTSIAPPAALANDHSTGLGLLGLAERVSLTGGAFHAGLVDDRWVVSVTVPRTTGYTPTPMGVAEARRGPAPQLVGPTS